MRKHNVLPGLALCFGLASAAFTGVGDNGGYGLLFWIFISFGVLVVLAQLIPAALVILGFVKGLPAGRKVVEAVEEKK